MQKGASDHADYNKEKMGVTSLSLSYKCLKRLLLVFLAGHIVATVTYCAPKLIVSS